MGFYCGEQELYQTQIPFPIHYPRTQQSSVTAYSYKLCMVSNKFCCIELSFHCRIRNLFIIQKHMQENIGVAGFCEVMTLNEKGNDKAQLYLISLKLVKLSCEQRTLSDEFNF